MFIIKLLGGYDVQETLCCCGHCSMLFDEATSALDPELVGEVLDTMRLLAEEGMTMICVTHEMGFARDVSDRVAYFHEGLMEEIGPPAQIFGDALSKNTRKFLANVR